MKFQIRALMISVGIGVIGFTIWSMVFGFSITHIGSYDPPAPMADHLCLQGSLLWIFMIGVGFAYVYFASRKDPVALKEGAIGGAIVGAAVGLISGVAFASIVEVIMLLLIAGLSGHMSVSDRQDTSLVFQIYVPVAIVVGDLLIGTIAGAIGGAIGAVTVGKHKVI